MHWDCHIHMVLDGMDWRAALQRHQPKPEDGWIRRTLALYHSLGVTYLRDGGDRWGVGVRARSLAPEYGICYRTPLAPLYKLGHYGGLLGVGFSDLREYASLVARARQEGADFLKIMISGLMDFDHFGVLTETELERAEIRELIHIAHQEGLAVMAHANGASTVEAAAEAGADSIEHGAYLDDGALHAMVENGVVWVPTLSTIGNLRGRGRFDERAVAAILESSLRNVQAFARMGGLLAPGTDAGAWAVPHGTQTEFPLFEMALGGRTQAALERGVAALREKF